MTVPFSIEFAGTSSSPKGWFFNGDEHIVSSSGRWDGTQLTLNFAQYASVLKANLANGTMKGTYDRGVCGIYPFTANPAKPTLSNTKVPNIAGTWDFAIKSTRGEPAWRFVVRQRGNEVTGAVLRVDGDTGTLTGHYENGFFRLSHFSGARPYLVDVRPEPDGSLSLTVNAKETYKAIRLEQARAANVPEPADTFRYTSFHDTSAPFLFSFPDLTGKTVSNTDPGFQGKVVVLAIGGSWCPNCHDEAPLLESLYRKYRTRGLEVVALSFEEGEQLKNPTRLREFIRHFGIDYTVLLVGEPEQLESKLPLATNLNSFPTTIFLGRDGRVAGVHTGFASRATGRFYDEQAKEMETLIEQLLAKNGAVSAVSKREE